jgi:hypothetical protein
MSCFARRFYLANQYLKKYFINTFIYRNQLRKTIKELKLVDPIIITAYNPMYGLPMINKLNEYLNIYYCYDGMDTQRHKSRIYNIENNFVKKVDNYNHI